MYNPFNPFDTKLGFRLDRSDGFLLGLRHASSPLKGLGWVLAVENPFKLCFHAFQFFEAAVSDVSQGQELWGRWKFDGNGGAGGEGSREWIQRGATAGRLRN